MASLFWLGAAHPGTEDPARNPEAAAAADPSPSFAAVSGWRSNLRASPDFITRFRHGKAAGHWEVLNAAGLDLLKTFSTRRRDVGTAVLQPYLVRRDNLFAVPNHVDSRDDWELELHQFWFNWTAPVRGRLRVRAGHLLIPYGLDLFADTHFTLRQLSNGSNLGAKMDWGVSANGELPRLDYEVALLRGSGMEYRDRGENHAVAGRLGTRRDRNWVIGVSGFRGRTWDPAGLRRYRKHGGMTDPGHSLVRRSRIGYDLTGIVGPFSLLHELSHGRDFEQSVWNGLAALSWDNRQENIRVHAQATWQEERLAGGRWRHRQVALGGSFRLGEHWSADWDLRFDSNGAGPGTSDTIFGLQARVHLH